MVLANIDIVIIAAFFAVSLFIGLWVARRSGANSTEFFLSGRNMPWWLLGISMVATTFAADTPNLVADIIRQNGVAGNWVWWAFLLTGMLTVFVYAKLWRRSGVLTDLEFYELRYSGPESAFLRGFRALYLGVFFNLMIMANVCLAAIKIGSVMLGLAPLETLLLASVVTVIYSSLGGLRGVLITDFFQFILAMIGSIGAAVVIVNLPEVGGLSQLLQHEQVVPKLSFFPDFASMSWEDLLPIFILPLVLQWWNVWYPGSEPGGGGYIAQRMLSAKSESHATGATLLFNVAHYAIRPWPWILIGLASLVVFPSLASIQAQFPEIDPSIVKNDLAYPAMLTYLPHGLLGLVIASLIAAFMSTLSTHLNWGSSYVVHDFYQRFIQPEASEKQLVLVGRISTAVLMLLSALVALALENALQAFQILLQIGAGTGLIFILRWFWWRINAYSEISAMIFSFLIAVYFQFIHLALGFEAVDASWQLIIGIALTSVGWITVTLFTRPTDEATLKAFYAKIRPAGKGWEPFKNAADSPHSSEGKQLSWQILSMLIGSISIYAALFTLGSLLYGAYVQAGMLGTVVLGGAWILRSIWPLANPKQNV